MSLNIIIVGAGIAGLTAAVSLHRSGHRVQVFESSAFSAQVGAAINLTPNGVLVLQHLGFNFQRASAVQMLNWDTVDGLNLRCIACQNLEDASERFGAPYFAIHRVDLHSELMRLAGASENENQASKGINLRLASPVKHVDAKKGSIELADGTVEYADLIVGADGLHSIVRQAVIKDKEQVKLIKTGHSAFRFLIPTETLEADPAGRELLERKSRGATLLVDTRAVEIERHLMWYPCRNGTVQNFVGIHPCGEENPETSQDFKLQMLREFGHFDPKVVKILRLAEDTKCWPLYTMKPLPSWASGKGVLIGDAAHPMLPFGGQGSNQAIEDGGALGAVLANMSDVAELPLRLGLFVTVRHSRASRVQILSSVRANNEHLVEEQLKAYMEPGVTLPNSFPKRIIHDARFDALAHCEEALRNMSTAGVQV